MTHDELVRFAAGKVGGQVLEGGVLLGSIIYDLTSPDLFLKGLGVLLDDRNLEVGICWDSIEIAHVITGKSFVRQLKAELGLEFWQCWAELAGGQG